MSRPRPSPVPSRCRHCPSPSPRQSPFLIRFPRRRLVLKQSCLTCSYWRSRSSLQVWLGMVFALGGRRFVEVAERVIATAEDGRDPVAVLIGAWSVYDADGAMTATRSQPRALGTGREDEQPRAAPCVVEELLVRPSRRGGDRQATNR